MCVSPGVTVRKEQGADVAGIAHLTEAAFRDVPYSSHAEQFIISALRRNDQLTISLVAVDEGAIVGHVAISPVVISSGAVGWYGLGPISVLPSYQRRGIGSMLMRAALNELRRVGGAGCVVLGDPAYYARFGFERHAGLELPAVPPEYFQSLAFNGKVPEGIVRYHDSFDVTA